MKLIDGEKLYETILVRYGSRNSCYTEDILNLIDEQEEQPMYYGD